MYNSVNNNIPPLLRRDLFMPELLSRVLLSVA